MPTLNGKPTEKEMKQSLDDLAKRLRHEEYNGNDIKKDREKGISEENQIKEMTFQQFKDNYPKRIMTLDVDPVADFDGI